MPLVINALRSTHTYRRANQSNFKKPGKHGLQPHAPDLKRVLHQQKELPSEGLYPPHPCFKYIFILPALFNYGKNIMLGVIMVA